MPKYRPYEVLDTSILLPKVSAILRYFDTYFYVVVINPTFPTIYTVKSHTGGLNKGWKYKNSFCSSFMMPCHSSNSDSIMHYKIRVAGLKNPQILPFLGYKYVQIEGIGVSKYRGQKYRRYRYQKSCRYHRYFDTN